MPEVEGEASAKRKFKAYPIGYFHIDIAEVRTAQGKLYLLVAIDRTSKFAFVELHEKVGAAPWMQWKDGQNELEAAQTYDHIAHSPNCSIAKAERMLGYRPRYRSIEAVCESVNWLIEKEIVQVERKAV